MKKSMPICATLFLICSLSAIEGPSGENAATVHPDTASRLLAMRNLPLDFVPNRGQMDDRVMFTVKGSDRTLYFTPSGVTIALFTDHPAERADKHKLAAGKTAEAEPGWVVKVDFIGCRQGVAPEGTEASGTMFSYFKGPRREWRTGIPGYRRIVYRDLWPGIDLVYKGEAGLLKYEFVVAAGADPNVIRLGVRGATAVNLDGKGRLAIETPLTRILDEKPLAFQEIQTGARTPVAVAYKVGKISSGEEQVGFALAEYDRELPLVIDPATLVYCGYIGGQAGDQGTGIAVDGAGNAYVVGWTFSMETFPVTVGPGTASSHFADVFVAKVNASGTGLIYCGFICGDDYDYGQDIAVDSAGNAYVTGLTASTEATFPVTVGPDTTYNSIDHFMFPLDAFVAKVNASGTGLDYCGYIGGPFNDRGNGIAVDGAGNAYVTGWTDSGTNFPVTVGPDLTIHSPLDHAFVAKVNALGTRLDYCGFIGGGGEDRGYDIAVNGAGNAYVTGSTTSTETTFPVTVGPGFSHNGGTWDAFVAKVSVSGNGLDYCGYIGGAGEDRGYGIDVDGEGSSYIAGYTESTEATFPVTVGLDSTYNGYGDAFAAKVNASGAGFDYCGYIGGDGQDKSYSIAVNGAGNAFVTGETGSTQATFPVTAGPDLTYNSPDTGGHDAFVARINASGSGLDFCGYIGGDDWDIGRGIAVDGASNVYVTGDTYSTEATFPVTVGPDVTFNGGTTHSHLAGIDAFVARIAFNTPGTKSVDLSLAKAIDNPVPRVGGTIVFTVKATNLGAAEATGVVVKDLLPVGLRFVSFKATKGTYNPLTGLWRVGRLLNGATASLSLWAKVKRSGKIVNTATVKALVETDSNALNNTATASLTAK